MNDVLLEQDDGDSALAVSIAEAGDGVIHSQEVPEVDREVQSLVETLGAVVVQQVSDRRGTQVFQIRVGRRLSVLKIRHTRVPLRDAIIDPLTVLENESSILAALSPIPVGYYEGSGRWGDVRWVKVRWIEGVPAHKWYGSGGRASERQAKKLIQLFIDCCDALIPIHDRGICHGDLQPGHFLVGAAGDAHLIDFGMAKRALGTEFPHEGGMAQFCSPEVAHRWLSGEDDPVLDPCAEVYSLGAVLWFIATGQPVYRGISSGLGLRDTLSRVVDGERLIDGEGETLGVIREVLPPEVMGVLRLALQKDRAERLPTVLSLRNELQVIADSW